MKYHQVLDCLEAEQRGPWGMQYRGWRTRSICILVCLSGITHSDICIAIYGREERFHSALSPGAIAGGVDPRAAVNLLCCSSISGR